MPTIPTGPLQPQSRQPRGLCAERAAEVLRAAPSAPAEAHGRRENGLPDPYADSAQRFVAGLFQQACRSPAAPRDEWRPAWLTWFLPEMAARPQAFRKAKIQRRR